MTVHLPTHRSVPRTDGPAGGTWIDVGSLDDLGMDIKDLGDGRIGLCPTPERCIPVPEDARRGDTVDLSSLAEALDLVVADDGHHAVIRHAPTGSGTRDARHVEVGDHVEVTLPDLDGHDRPMIPPHGRAAVFAWASW
jgi:hypothetical protein